MSVSPAPLICTLQCSGTWFRMNLVMTLACRLKNCVYFLSTSLQWDFKAGVFLQQVLMFSLPSFCSSRQPSMAALCCGIIPTYSKSFWVYLQSPVKTIPNALQKSWKEGSQPPLPPGKVTLTSFPQASFTPLNSRLLQPLMIGLNTSKKYLGSKCLYMDVLVFTILSIATTLSSNLFLISATFSGAFSIKDCISKHAFITLAKQKAPITLAPRKYCQFCLSEVNSHLSWKSQSEKLRGSVRYLSFKGTQLYMKLVVIPGLYRSARDTSQRGTQRFS